MFKESKLFWSAVGTEFLQIFYLIFKVQKASYFDQKSTGTGHYKALAEILFACIVLRYSG
jgi:hypothetical protein